MIRLDGYVKVLDFGLAKRIGRAEADSTVTADISFPGQMVGTIAYMSPEQIEGREADHRSDLFSFGILLYEMLLGRHPWSSVSTVDLLYAILHNEAS
jgi:serine/threonine protein kinase